jgi:hypothetical protein
LYSLKYSLSKIDSPLSTLLFPTKSLSDNFNLAALPSLLILNVVRVAEDRISLGPFFPKRSAKIRLREFCKILNAVSTTFKMLKSFLSFTKKFVFLYIFVLTANSNFKKMSEQVNEQYTLQYTHNTSTFGANLFQQLSIMCTILVPFFVLYLGPLSQIFAYTQYGTFSSACTLNRI